MSYDLSKVPKVDTSICIPKEEYAARVKELRRKMAERSLDIGILYSNPYMPGDVMYFCGYDPQLENPIALVSQEKFILLTGPEGSNNAAEQLTYGEIRVPVEMNMPDEDYPNFYDKYNKLEDIIDELHPGKIRRVGLLTRSDVMAMNVLEMLRPYFRDADIVDASDIVYYQMRFLKSVNEMAVQRISNQICAEGLKAMIESLEEGMTELELTAVGDYVMKRMGASVYGFDTFLLSGPRINTIIGRGTHKVIKRGELVSIGVASRFNGYASTARRMAVCGGEPTKAQKELMDRTVKAHELAVEQFVEGNRRCDLNRTVTKYFDQFDLSKYQVYTCAHGTGIHECQEGIPFIQYDETPIARNCSMMIDIGLYNHPELYGSCIENPYLINEKGETECLNDLPLVTY